MLVVADERTIGNLRQGGLAGAAETEEHGHIAVFAVVGGSVHGQDALRRQCPVQPGEDRLLHFAGIVGAADKNDLAGEVERNNGLGLAAVASRISLEGRQVDDGQVRNEAGQFRSIGANQQVADKQRVPCKFGDDPCLYPEGRIGAPIQVLHEQVHAFHVLVKIAKQSLELVRRDRIIVAPPDLVFGGGITDGMLIFGRAAGMDAGFGIDRPAGHDHGFVAANGLFVKRSRAEIVGD